MRSVLTDQPFAVQLEASNAWVDYRQSGQVAEEDLKVAHVAFLAGWKAARFGREEVALER